MYLARFQEFSKILSVEQDYKTIFLGDEVIFDFYIPTICTAVMVIDDDDDYVLNTKSKMSINYLDKTKLILIKDLDRFTFSLVLAELYYTIESLLIGYELQKGKNK